jgi:hypothetical protein
VGKRLQNSPVGLALLIVPGRLKGTQAPKEATTYVHKSVRKLDGPGYEETKDAKERRYCMVVRKR